MEICLKYNEAMNKINRRKFISNTAVTGVGLMLGAKVSANTQSSENFRMLGKLKVSPQGLGGLPVAGFYGGGLRVQSEVNNLYRLAFDNGVSFFDTAEVYASFENEKQVGEAIAPFRKKIVLATKFGFDIDAESRQNRGLNSRPEHIRKALEGSLKRLKTDYIDLYYQHRVDPSVPIEDVAGLMKDFIKEGKILHWGLSEPGLKTIRRAHLVQPITAIQNEYSLWTRDPEKDVLAICEELGIGFVPWCPLGYGFFGGGINEVAKFVQGDFRGILPRLTRENLAQNLKLYQYVKDWGVKKQATTAQISLAWLQAQKPSIVPIPGTSKTNHLIENIKANQITFTKQELNDFNAGLDLIEIKGPRNAKMIMDGMGVESAVKI